MVEGEIQEGGLSAMSDGTGSILGELAKVINGELKTENPLEIFSRINKFNNAGKEIRQDNMPTAEESKTTEQIIISTITNGSQLLLFG